MANKIIRGVEEDAWRIFTGLCKIKNVKVGTEITNILKDYIEQESKRAR